MPDDLLEQLGRRVREDPPSEPSSRVLTPDDRSRLLDGVMERLDAAERVAPLQPSRRRIPWLGGVVAIAAAAVLWLALMVGEHGPQTQTVAQMPAYELTRLHGAIQASRGSEDPVPPVLKLRGDENLEWVLTPATPTEVSEVALVAAPDPDPGSGATGGRVQAITLAPPLAAVSDSGAIRIHIRLDRHFELTEGRWTFHVLVAGPAGFPDTPESTLASPPDGTWREVAIQAMLAAE